MKVGSGKRWEKAKRFGLWLMLIAGVRIAAWPFAEAAYGELTQRQLRAQFESEWQQLTQEAASPEVAQAAREPESKPSEKAPDTAATSMSAVKTADAQASALRNLKKSKRLASAQSARWMPTRILIPKIGVDAIVVRGVSDRALKRGPGHDPYTALPGQPGNCVIAAHRNAYGWWFYRLNKLGPGELIYLQTPRATYAYEVAYSDVAHSSETNLLGPPRSPDAAPRLTLYSCTLPKSSRRVMVFANLVSSPNSSTASFKKAPASKTTPQSG